MSDKEREEFVKASQRLWDQIADADIPQEVVQQCFTEVIDEEILRDLRAAANRADRGSEGQS